MIYNGTKKIQRNFRLSEAIEWAYRSASLNTEDQTTAFLLAKQALNTETLINIVAAASRLQQLRDHLNSANPDYELYIRVTSWLRHPKWERHRKRDGTSQHTKGHATDIVVMGMPKKYHEYAQEQAYIWLKSQPGWTKKYDTFIHNDLRGLLD